MNGKELINKIKKAGKVYIYADSFAQYVQVVKADLYQIIQDQMNTVVEIEIVKFLGSNHYDLYIRKDYDD